MSDNLLGYNPMAKASSTNKNVKATEKPTGPIIGVDSNTEGGGVWAQTNAKRDKLGEIRLELKWDQGQKTLDDAATPEEKLDLYLIDGIKAITSFVDGQTFRGVPDTYIQSEMSMDNHPALKDFGVLMKEYEEERLSQINVEDENEKIMIDKQEFETHMNNLLEHVEQFRSQHVAAPPSSDENKAAISDVSKVSPLAHIRDVMEYYPPNEIQPTVKKGEKEPQSESVKNQIPASLGKELYSPAQETLQSCSEYYRILLVQSCLLHLQDKFEELTQVSDADMDRAATTGEILESTNTIDVAALHKVIEAFGSGSCVQRVEALWHLIDQDNDGLLDQVEMDRVVMLSIHPVEEALRAFAEDCTDVWPMRSMEIPGQENNQLVEEQNIQKGRYKKWKEQRAEKKAKKAFMKMVNKAIKRHFDIDVEVPHRLRCCYAWADKTHQDGKLQSVLVEENQGDQSEESGKSSGNFLTSAKKRYVELDPKISYSEFRAEQKEMFPHLDRVSQELCTGSKEELWILQGTGRQNAELKRESLAFLAVVSMMDAFITLS